MYQKGNNRSVLSGNKSCWWCTCSASSVHQKNYYQFLCGYQVDSQNALVTSETFHAFQVQIRQLLSLQRDVFLLQNCLHTKCLKLIWTQMSQKSFIKWLEGDDYMGRKARRLLSERKRGEQHGSNVLFKLSWFTSCFRYCNILTAWTCPFLKNICCALYEPIMDVFAEFIWCESVATSSVWC